MKKGRLAAHFLAGAFLFFAFSPARAASLGERLASLVLETKDGVRDSLSSYRQHLATVFVFVSSECPISNSYMPLLTAMAKEFGTKNIALYAVISDPDVPVETAKHFAAEYAFDAGMLMDRDQKLA